MRKELPILLNADMVRASIAGTKTETRRIIQPQPFIDELGHIRQGKINYGKTLLDVPALKNFTACVSRYQPGDILYGREAWRVYSWDHIDSEIKPQYLADNAIGKYSYIENEDAFNKLWIQSCDDLFAKDIIPDEKTDRFPAFDPVHLRKRPSIHMLKALARLWFEVVDVTTERIQDITDAGALAEGIEVSHVEVDRAMYRDYSGGGYACGTPKSSFLTLWSKVYGPESWERNDWVFVNKYKVLSTTGRPEGI